jgi:site-specific recombinase XerD
MATVRFNLRKNRKSDPTVQLVYRYDSDRQKITFSTGLKAKANDWNDKIMRYKSIKSKPEHHDYNLILNKWVSSFTDVIRENEIAGLNKTANELKEQVLNKFNANNSQGSKAVSNDLYQYFEKFINEKKETLVTNDTIKSYRNALNHLISYRSSKLRNRKIQLNDVNRSFLIGLNKYLIEKGLDHTTVHKIRKRLDSVLTHARKKDLYTLSDYKDSDIKIKAIKHEKIYLTTSEIKKVLDLKLPKDGKLDRVRDRFIIQVFTGIRLKDLRELSKQHINSLNGKPVLKKLLHKCKNINTIPLNSMVVSILSKHDYNPPQFSDQKYRDYLKELCKEANIDQEIVTNKNKKQVNFKKYEKVGSHTLRRSFATNALISGVPLNAITYLMGHSKTSQTLEYICIDEQEVLKQAFSNSFFK